MDLMAGVVGLAPLHGVVPHELPPLTPQTALTTWVLEPLPALLILATGVLYGLGVRKLRARGDHWSLARSASFFIGGLGILVVATQSFLAAYDLTLLSVHMVQHMLLNMVAPIFLALGAPITLALRTLPRRSRGVLLKALHSRVVKVLTFPLVAMVIFIFNPWVLYFSELYEATLRNGWLHDLNHLHFLLVGCLWYWAILGLDPLPNRPSHPMRLIAVLLTMPFHAFLGVTIMSANTLIAGDWYTALDRDWGPTPVEDQQLAGGILWGSGDIIAALLFVVLAVQWSRASDREARAIDRRLDLAEARAAAAARAAATVGASGAGAGSGSTDPPTRPEAAAEVASPQGGEHDRAP